MKIGDKVQVCNLGKTDFADSTVKDILAGGLIKVQVDHPGHDLHGKLLTVDESHYRIPKKD